jgi:hypothetical protein
MDPAPAKRVCFLLWGEPGRGREGGGARAGRVERGRRRDGTSASRRYWLGTAGREAWKWEGGERGRGGGPRLWGRGGSRTGSGVAMGVGNLDSF